MEFDPVNKPKHYNVHPSGVECIDIVGYLPYPVGNAIKYVWRFEDKNDPKEDLNKAKFYLDWCLEHIDWLDDVMTHYDNEAGRKLNLYCEEEFKSGYPNRAEFIDAMYFGLWDCAKNELNGLIEAFESDQKSGGSEPVTLQKNEFVVRQDTKLDEKSILASWERINNERLIAEEQNKDWNGGGSVYNMSPYSDNLRIESPTGKYIETTGTELIELIEWARTVKQETEWLQKYVRLYGI